MGGFFVFVFVLLLLFFFFFGGGGAVVLVTGGKAGGGGGGGGEGVGVLKEVREPQVGRGLRHQGPWTRGLSSCGLSLR